jgi:hypothetical protein
MSDAQQQSSQLEATMLITIEARFHFISFQLLQ